MTGEPRRRRSSLGRRIALPIGAVSAATLLVAGLVLIAHRDPGRAASHSASSAPASTSPSPESSTGTANTIEAEEREAGNARLGPHPTSRRSGRRCRGGRAHAEHAQRGETVGLYVSTAAPTFHIEAIRLGWYAGAEGRGWCGAASRSPASSSHRRRPTRQPAWGAPWQRSTDVVVGPDWTPGMYVLKLVSSDGGQSMVPLTVRDDTSHSEILVSSAVTTWQAYNGWGGASLYSGGPEADPRLRGSRRELRPALRRQRLG